MAKRAAGRKARKRGEIIRKISPPARPDEPTAEQRLLAAIFGGQPDEQPHYPIRIIRKTRTS